MGKARRLWCITFSLVFFLFAVTGSPAVFSLLSLSSIFSCVRLMFFYTPNADETKVLISDDDVIEHPFSIGEAEAEGFEIDDGHETVKKTAVTMPPLRKKRLLFILGHAIVIVGSVPLVCIRPMATLPMGNVMSFGCVAVAPLVFLYASEI